MRGMHHTGKKAMLSGLAECESRA